MSNEIIVGVSGNLKGYSKFNVLRNNCIGIRDGVTDGGGSIPIWWDKSKKNLLTENVMSFDGEWKTSLDIIFERDAYKDEKGVHKAILELETIIRSNRKKQAWVKVMEYGEDEILPEFPTVKSITPHFHCLFECSFTESEFNKLNDKLIELIETSSFYSFKLAPVRDEEACREYVCKERKGTFHCKPPRPPKNWEGMNIKVQIWYKNLCHRNQIDYRVNVSKALLGVTGQINWKKRNLRQLRLYNDWSSYAGSNVEYKDLDLSRYSKLELMFLMKNCLLYHKGDYTYFNIIGEHLNSVLDENYTYRLSNILEYHSNGSVGKWSYDKDKNNALASLSLMIKEARRCGLYIPPLYDHKAPFIYSWDDWKTIITPAYYGKGSKDILPAPGTTPEEPFPIVAPEEEREHIDPLEELEKERELESVELQEIVYATNEEMEQVFAEFGIDSLLSLDEELAKIPKAKEEPKNYEDNPNNLDPEVWQDLCEMWDSINKPVSGEVILES